MQLVNFFDCAQVKSNQRISNGKSESTTYDGSPRSDISLQSKNCRALKRGKTEIRGIEACYGIASMYCKQ